MALVGTSKHNARETDFHQINLLPAGIKEWKKDTINSKLKEGICMRGYPYRGTGGKDEEDNLKCIITVPVQK